MSTASMNRDSLTPPLVSADAYADTAHRKTVMRQTQALMGIVLLGGLAAAYFVNMVWVVVPVVIGAGLVFAGASGLCPMASLIARMPWNNADETKHRAKSDGCCGGRCG